MCKPASDLPSIHPHRLIKPLRTHFSISVAARSKEWVCGRSFAGISGSVSVRRADHSYRGVLPSLVRKSWPTRGCRTMKRIYLSVCLAVCLLSIYICFLSVFRAIYSDHHQLWSFFSCNTLPYSRYNNNKTTITTTTTMMMMIIIILIMNDFGFLRCCCF